jgi:hypothetical protein
MMFVNNEFALSDCGETSERISDVRYLSEESQTVTAQATSSAVKFLI